jgi:hypothetical protein
MPRTSRAGLERAKETADKYISRSGGTPRGPLSEVVQKERAAEKEKIRNQRDEIVKLKWTIKTLGERPQPSSPRTATI